MFNVKELAQEKGVGTPSKQGATVGIPVSIGYIDHVHNLSLRETTVIPE